jgi:hypothetical protein
VLFRLFYYGTLCHFQETANFFRLFLGVASGGYPASDRYEISGAFPLILLRHLMPHPGNSNLYRCFLVWRLASYICRLLTNTPQAAVMK